jgi:tetratricopeptide (TPR) repeat protein
MPYDEQDLLEMLTELEQRPTLSWLSGMIYEIAADQLLNAGELQTGAGNAFMQLMRAELRYHREVETIVDRDELDLAALGRLNRRHETALEHNMDNLAQVEPKSAASRGVRELGMAECCLRLGRLNAALTHMEQALTDGARQPLLHLAIGYAKYQRTMEDFGPVEQLDEARRQDFQVACLEAVTALEVGLGEGIDSQIYWWVATILNAAGFEEAAEEAFGKARAAEEAEEANEARWGADRGLGEGELAEADAAAENLPQITPLEERMVAEELRKPTVLRDVLGDQTDFGEE